MGEWIMSRREIAAATFAALATLGLAGCASGDGSTSPTYVEGYIADSPGPLQATLLDGCYG